MTVRKACKDDMAAIMSIEKDAFAAQIQEKTETFAERMEVFGGGFLIFEDDGNVAGYFCSERWYEIPDNDVLFSLGHPARKTHVSDGKVLYISSFAIFSKFRGKGLGRKLFCKALDFILLHEKGIKQLLLLVNEQWKGALNIYSEYGFQKIRCVDGVFPESQGIIMKKELA